MHPRLVVATRFAWPMQRYPKKKYILNPAWLHARVHIYLQYTLPSLQNQSDRDFDILLWSHPMVEELMSPYVPLLTAAGVTVVFGGAYTYIAELPAEYDAVQMVRIDSDDMYAVHAIRNAKRRFTEGNAIQFHKGYWFNARTGKLRHWSHDSPPCYGVQQHRDRIDNRRWGSNHRRFREVFRPIRMRGRHYCMVHHGMNIVGGRRFGKKLLDPASVLPRFGMSEAVWRRRGLKLPPRPDRG